ncbi:MAG TPA: class I SAM-dependent methyltransferase [Anaerolineae bacterium]|nr:class I SAM-dependent methyltransferase [Anaerolineae bacterium]
MPTYWDRFARTYTNIGEAEFWLKHHLRITEGLSGRVLEVCCGGGRLVLELLKVGMDAYGIDLSPQMTAQAQATLAQAGWDPARIVRADVTRLPFPDAAFDAVNLLLSLPILLGAMALTRQADRIWARGCSFRPARSSSD